MTAVSILPFRRDGWTVDDLFLLPEDDLRYELVDGTLLVSPPPPATHDFVASELSHLLHDLLPREWVVFAPGSIEFDDRNWRRPDLLVATRASMRQKWPQPGDVLLAVEVMSPGSRSTDRLVKPAQYAAAGIPHFWRFEQEPLLLVTHGLEGDVYRETGRYDDEVTVEEPVSLRFRLADLLP